MSGFFERFRIWLEKVDDINNTLSENLTHVLHDLNNTWPTQDRNNLEILYQCLTNYLYFPVYPAIASSPIRHVQRGVAEHLLYQLKAFLQNACGLIDTSDIAYLSPILNIHRKYHLAIGSTNYDLCLETLLSHHNVPYRYHISAQLHKDVRLQQRPISLLKIHGSVNWYRNSENQIRIVNDMTRIPISHDAQSERPAIPERLLVYPGFGKTEMADDFGRIRRLLFSKLQSADFVVVAGYSFVDRHIQKLFADAFAGRKGTASFFLISPDARAIAPHIASSIGIAEDKIYTTDKRHGIFGQALRSGWIEEQIEKNSRIRSHHKGLISPVINNPLFRRHTKTTPKVCFIPIRKSGRISGILADERKGRLYLADYDKGIIHSLNSLSRRSCPLIQGLVFPRAMRWLNRTGDKIIIVQNGMSDAMGTRTEGRGSIVVVETRAVRSDSSENRLLYQSNKYLSGKISWPSDILIRNNFVYVTAARTIMKLNLQTNEHTEFTPFAQAFNICSLFSAKGGIGILDHGIGERYGTGRIMFMGYELSQVQPIAHVGPYSWSVQPFKDLVAILFRPPRGTSYLAFWDLTRLECLKIIRLDRLGHSLLIDQSGSIYVGVKGGLLTLENPFS